MTGSGAMAKIKASVDVRPTHSQAFLVATAVVAAISVICSAGLFAAGRPGGWPLLGFGAIVLVVGFWAWSKSQSDSDLRGGHPTEFQLSDGTKLATDSRLIRSPQGVQAFTQLIDEILYRRQIPEAAALVDSNGQVIPDSEDAASAVVSKINRETQAITDELIDKLRLAEEAAPHNALQQPVGTSIAGPEIPPPQNLNAVIDATVAGADTRA